MAPSFNAADELMTRPAQANPFEKPSHDDGGLGLQGPLRLLHDDPLNYLN